MIREPSPAIRPLFEEVYVAALPASHRLARQKQIALSSLVNEPLIFYPRSLAPVLYANFIKCCEQAGFVPNVVQEAELAQTRLGLAAAGVGIAFVLSKYLFEKSLKGLLLRTQQQPFQRLFKPVLRCNA